MTINNFHSPMMPTAYVIVRQTVERKYVDCCAVGKLYLHIEILRYRSTVEFHVGIEDRVCHLEHRILGGRFVL